MLRKIYIVRHGETEENRRRILQGHLPGTLTEEGKRQIAKAAEKLAEEDARFTRIVSSDLRRAMDSAAIIADRLRLPVEPMEALRERDWGRFNGITIAEAKDKYFSNGHWAFPDNEAESEEAISGRARAVLRRLRENYPGENIIVVTHGQLARYLIAVHFSCTFQEVAPFLNGEVRSINVHEE